MILAVSIHPERADDRELIADVNREAFGRDNEARFIDAVRATPDFVPQLSLVAVRRREIIGHAMLSRVAVLTDEAFVSALALAPNAVLPKVQRQGVGSALVQATLDRAAALGHRMVFVVGHPNFYPRFGFVPARPLGLEPPFSVPDEVFLVHELEPGAAASLRGQVIFPEAFAVL